MAEGLFPGLKFVACARLADSIIDKRLLLIEQFTVDKLASCIAAL